MNAATDATKYSNATALAGTTTSAEGTVDSGASAIQRLIARYKDDPKRNKPVTMREYLTRMQTIPRLAALDKPVNGFAQPGDLNQSVLRLVTGLISSRTHRASFRDEMDKPVSIVREMLLLCFEAKPRQLSLAMSGYTSSDFLAYVYQDVARDHMELPPSLRSAPFTEIVEDIKSWLRIPPPASAQNSPRRHIRRRIMVTMDRSNHQAASLMEDREMPSEILYLIQKLLERDDDQGYTRGDIRDFQEVRDDLNALAEHCMRIRYEPTDQKIEDLDMVCCPSLVHDFASHRIQRQRGRPVLHGRKSRVKKDEQPNPPLKRASKKSTAAAPRVEPKPAETPVAVEDDFGLSVLKNLI